MEKDKIAVNTPESAATQTDVSAVVQEDLQAKYSQLETEKNKAIEESANWKAAFFSEKKKHRGSDSEDIELDEEEKMERIAKKALADSRLADIAREQQAIIEKALKENKELKLAHMNKSNTTPPAGIGSSTESTPVRDTVITPEQAAAFKARGWTEKDIERYKKNLQRNMR